MRAKLALQTRYEIPEVFSGEIPVTNVAAGASALAIYAVPVPQIAGLIRATVFGRDTVSNQVAVYQVTAAVRNQPSRAVKATGVLTLSGVAQNNETVTIGSKVYTFQTSLTNVDGNVLIGGSAAASIDNLFAAINRGAGAGTTYAALMTAHPTVEASAETATTLTVRALTAGTAGNSLASTETMTNGAFGAATLAGGADSVVIVGSPDIVAFEDDTDWAVTIAANGLTGRAEIRVTADASNITAFSGYVEVIQAG